MSRKESYKAQRQHYRKEKKRAASALLHSIEDPSVVVLADWLKVRGTLKSWTKLWCVLKPGLLLLYKSPKAKSSHWVGTVLLASCQVIERPSKKDGFCFKLYHPLEQSIWAPRGPHNETIGAVVQPLPTAHLIFRAPSQAAGHCWLDRLELALRCTNAMLRCSRSRPEQTVTSESPATQTNISHEELEKHFNEHELAGAASDTDSEPSRGGMPDGPRDDAQDRRLRELQRLHEVYVEDPDRECGTAGELVEEVAEENKSLLWFLVKQVRPGMDLSKVVLPTFILEPRSFLDKLSDNYYHADILAQAQHIDDPYQRFKCVLRWYLSGLYRKPKGLKKPYNPVLGETFRCCWKHRESDTYTYYVAEQVSHHPPVSAFYVSNRQEGFVIEGSLLARSKFYGNSTSAILEGCARVHLLPWGETYVTTAPYAHCKGIVIGTLSMELGGKVHILCAETGYQADVEFKLRSFLGGSETNAISGRIKKGKDTVATVDGYWDGKIDIKDKRSGEETSLLDVALLKEQRMARFLMRLDLQQEYESQRLWLKVSEAILNEDQVAATEQKTIIEEAQRSRARNLINPWVPRFFHRDPHVNPPEGLIDQGWKYNHGNTSPWMQEEVMEFEQDFVIRSAKASGTGRAPSECKSVGRALEAARGGSDSDSRDELARRSKASTRTIKQTLYAMDATLREQTVAIERLVKAMEVMNESQRAAVHLRPQNVGRVPPNSHSWDLFAGFVLAMILQALLNWIFYQKD